MFLPPRLKSEFPNDFIVVDKRTIFTSQNKDDWRKSLDDWGQRSAIAQKLPKPVTSWSMMTSNPHRLYLLRSEDSSKVLGMLKVGRKQLYVYNPRMEMVRIEPLCVLDFYVHESVQRTGLGLKLFSFMLEHEELEAKDLAYDRPSNKFVQFLKKHFKLSKYIKQANNFVVFNDYYQAHAVSR